MLGGWGEIRRGSGQRDGAECERGLWCVGSRVRGWRGWCCRGGGGCSSLS
jgi:hypothetical protein